MIVLTNLACVYTLLCIAENNQTEQCTNGHTLSHIMDLQTMTLTFASSPVSRRFYTKRLPSEAGINHGVNNQYCRHSEKCCATGFPKSPADTGAEQLQESDQRTPFAFILHPSTSKGSILLCLRLDRHPLLSETL